MKSTLCALQNTKTTYLFFQHPMDVTVKSCLEIRVKKRTAVSLGLVYHGYCLRLLNGLFSAIQGKAHIQGSSKAAALPVFLPCSTSSNSSVQNDEVSPMNV